MNGGFFFPPPQIYLRAFNRGNISSPTAEAQLHIPNFLRSVKFCMFSI